VSLDRLEVVLVEVVGNLIAEHGSLRVGGAEMDAGPYSGIDDLHVRVREPVEAARGTGFIAERAEADLGRDYDLISLIRERFSDQLFAQSVSISIGRIKKGYQDRTLCASVRAASPSVKFPHQPVEIVQRPNPTSLTVRSVFLYVLKRTCDQLSE
jgi:hypothetical protein